MDEQTTNDLSQRVIRLEGQNRRLRWYVLVLATLFSTMLLMGQTKLRLAEEDTEKDTIDAEEFVLLDAEGNPRAMLGMMAEGPYFTFFNEVGNSQLSFSLAPVPFLKMSDGSGDGRIFLSVLEDGVAVFSVHGPDGKSGFAVVGKEGGLGCELYDTDGEMRAKLWLTEEGEPRLGLFGKNTEDRVMLCVSEREPGLSLAAKDGEAGVMLSLAEGEPCLSLFGKDGEAGVGLRLAEGEPRLSLFDKDGQIRTMLSLWEGEPSLGLFDKEGKVRAALSATEGEVGLTLWGTEGEVLFEAP